jgi:hypothetical protein
MRKSRFSEERIIGILKQRRAGLGAKELCRKAFPAVWRVADGGGNGAQVRSQIIS